MKLYIAHLSFTIDAPNQPFSGGRLHAVVRAPTVVIAVDTVKALLHDAKKRVSMLVNVKRIDLDSLTEMNAVPSGGLVTLIQWDDRETAATMEIAPRLTTDDGIVVYAGPRPSDAEDVPPFVEFVD